VEQGRRPHPRRDQRGAQALRPAEALRRGRWILDGGNYRREPDGGIRPGVRAAPARALRSDRLLQLRGDLVCESLDPLLVRALDQDPDLRLRPAVADEDAPVLAELLLHL